MSLFRPNARVTQRTYAIWATTFVALVLVAWSALHTTLPSPMAVVAAFKELWSQGVLTSELLSSLITNIKAIAWSTTLSLVLAYATVLPAMRFPVELATKARFLGLTGLTLPFTLLFPNGDTLRVAILTFAMTANFLTSMADVVAAIPREEFDHARTLGMSEWRAVWDVVILGRADEAFEVLRQNAAIGWMMLTMVEVISQSGGGIGLVLYKVNRNLDLLPQVVAILLVIVAVGYLQDRFISLLKRTLCPYASLTLER